VVDCSRCGDFAIDRAIADDLGLPFEDQKKRALANYVIRKMQSARRPLLAREFWRALETRSLPTPAEASDNLLTWLAEQADGSPGSPIQVVYGDHSLLGSIGVIGGLDLRWIVDSLLARGLVQRPIDTGGHCRVTLTAQGWQRFEELKQGHISSRFAFFARQFDNSDLDQLFENCLRRAVQETGYELRMAPQKAGLIDAVIEDEIRRCRFVIADLSDDNAGAYWEAGLAEGLGKDVIYICHATLDTHFDTNHRQTVRWDLADPERTARDLKAVIRNTLLGDANQAD